MSGDLSKPPPSASRPPHRGPTSISHTSCWAVLLDGSVPSLDRRVHRIPLVFLLDQAAQPLDQVTAAVTVRHDDRSVAIHAVRHEVASEAPVAPGVHEVPPLAL